MRLCNLGKKSPFDVATELDCTYEQVMAHINGGHELQVDDQGRLQSSDVLLKRLSDNLNTLQDWADFVTSTVSGSADLDNNKIRMLTTLVKEIRGGIGDIAELQGRKGPGDAIMQVQVLNARVVDLTNTIIDVCCDDCKLKILGAIEKQNQIGSGGAALVSQVHK